MAPSRSNWKWSRKSVSPWQHFSGVCELRAPLLRWLQSIQLMRGGGRGCSIKQETCLLAWFLPSRGAEESFLNNWLPRLGIRAMGLWLVCNQISRAPSQASQWRSPYRRISSKWAWELEGYSVYGDTLSLLRAKNLGFRQQKWDGMVGLQICVHLFSPSVPTH